jgi:hypothetical protein
MAIKFRFLYADPNPIPASHFVEAEHGTTVFPTQPIDGIQFIDTEADPNEVEPTTVLINSVLDALTDEDGYLRGVDVDPLERLAVRAAMNAADNGEDVREAVMDALKGAL